MTNPSAQETHTGGASIRPRKRLVALLTATGGSLGAVALLLSKVNPIASIAVPVAVSVAAAWCLPRLLQRVRPVAVTGKIHDADLAVTSNAQIPASGHTVRINIESAGPTTVLLEELRAVVVGRTNPGGRLSIHFGVVDVRPFEVLLDREPPVVRAVPPSDGGPIVDFPLTVAPNSPECLDLTVLTEKADVRWFLELDTVCLGRRKTIRIDLAGQPFRTTARPDETIGRTP